MIVILTWAKDCYEDMEDSYVTETFTQGGTLIDTYFLTPTEPCKDISILDKFLYKYSIDGKEKHLTGYTLIVKGIGQRAVSETQNLSIPG